MTDTPHETPQDHNQDILPAKFVLNKYRIIFIALTLVAVGLAACGGGTSGSLSSLERIRELTGMTAPVETPVAQNARARYCLAIRLSDHLYDVCGNERR